MRPSSLALACLAALPAAAPAADASMQAWKAYAQHAMTPSFSWAAAPAAPAPTVLDAARERLFADVDAAISTAFLPVGALRLSVGQGAAGSEALPHRGELQQSLSPLSQSFASTSLVQPVGTAGAFSLTAIVAEQRYATPGFGTADWAAPLPRVGIVHNGDRETASGGGVRLAFDRRVGGAVSWNLTLQSRLAMDAFKTYRGVYSEAGDFDVPGYLQTGLTWRPGAQFELSTDIRRVFYSEVDAFTSSALPVRFLSLLGSATAPEFAWRDLTVMSVEVARATHSDGRWSLRYSTQQQPRPSSGLLDRALSEQYSDLNLALAFEQGLGAFGKLRFAASYSPASYFLGTVPFTQAHFDGGAQTEVEAQWRMTF